MYLKMTKIRKIEKRKLLFYFNFFIKDYLITIEDISMKCCTLIQNSLVKKMCLRILIAIFVVFSKYKT